MDFDAQTSVVTVTEFLAVLIAGFGNNLVPLTSDNGDESSPKALLPIANRPMIEYPLAWLEQSEIKDVLLICPSTQRSAISHYLHNESTSFASLRIDLQGFDEGPDEDQGTSAILLHYAHKIQTDFILLPCDILPSPSLPLSRIMNKYRADIGADGTIAASLWFETGAEKGPFEEGEVASTAPIIWDPVSSTLLYVNTEDDASNLKTEISLRSSLISRYPRVQMSAKFQDSHVYICRKSVLDVLGQKPRLESFRGDFLPWLCKLQYQTTRRDKYGRVLFPLVQPSSRSAALAHSTMYTGPKDSYTAFLSNPGSPNEDSEESVVTHEDLRIGLVLHRMRDGPTVRVNTLNAFLDANCRALSAPGYTYTVPSEPDRRSLVDVKAQISADSLIGDSTKVGERTTIKKSVIGKHCTIGKMVKIVGCVILDHCVIEDGAKLESCLIGRNSKIGAKADLSRCASQPGYDVDAGETLKNEKLEASNWAAAEESDDDTASTKGDESD